MPNAIISVYDKTGLDSLGKLLCERGFHIYATAGTLKYLQNSGVNVSPVELIAGNPKGFEKFVSSLSFNTLIGTLAEDTALLRSLSICPIDLVVYNFVPAWEIVQALDDFNIQNVDLGGPTIVKAAAINFRNVLPIVSPKQYELLEKYPDISLSSRILLAKAALKYCADYDRRLSDFLFSFL